MAQPLNFRSLLSDPWIRIILAAGILLRLSIAIGIHYHFRNADPPNLWPGTDEAAFYTYGLSSSEYLQLDGWRAFINSSPEPAYFNWLHFKYTGIILYLSGGSPFELRIFSILFSILGIVFFALAFGRFFSKPYQLRLFVSLLALIPSSAFWSALAIKEGLLSFLAALICWGLVTFWSRPKPWTCLAWISLLCLVLGSSRIWMGVGFFCVAAPLVLILHPGRPSTPIMLLALSGIVLSLFLLPNSRLMIGQSLLHWHPDPSLLMNPDLNLFPKLSALEGKQHPLWLKPLLAWVFPLPFISNGSLLMRLAGVENLVFLFLSLLAISGALKKHSPLDPVWLGMAVIIIFTAAVLGSNLGTIYRDKSAALPYLAYFAACALPVYMQKLQRF